MAIHWKLQIARHACRRSTVARVGPLHCARQRDAMNLWNRLFRINLALWGYLVWWSLVRLRLRRPRVSPPERLAQVLEGLGTTFVKLGQGLSLHRELLPDAYVQQLQRLQYQVQTFDPALARQEVERSFGPLEQVFAGYESEPFAAGSIAQVHRALMLDGREVVVKVRRPGIRRMVEQDVRILRWFLRSMLWIVPGLKRVRPYELVDELARNLQREIDLRQEAVNNERFSEMFRDDPDVMVPAVIDGLYTEWAMVQEMMHGQRIDSPALAADGPRLAHVLVEAYLRQFFREGVFHGDPHPGNLFVSPQGRLCLHDFGLVGFLDRATRLNLVAFMLAFAQQDAEWLLEAFLDLGMLAGAIDRDELRHGLEGIIQDYARKPLRDWSFGEAFLRVTRIGSGQNIRVPHHLLVLMRAIFLMESTVRRLDPAFNLLEGLFARAGAVLRETEAAAPKPPVDRLKFEALLLARQAPQALARLAHELRGLAWPGGLRGLLPPAPPRDLQVSRRLACAICAAGLFLASAWLRVGSTDVLLPAIGLAAGAWLTWKALKKESS